MTMTRIELARLIDHSVLKPEAVEADVQSGADTVRTWQIGYFCVQPCWVSLAARRLAGTTAMVASVIGFPHGADRTDVKARAAALAVDDGAGEIDMVQNFGALKSGQIAQVAADIEAVVRAVPGIAVKVILETAALTDEEKKRWRADWHAKRAPLSSRRRPAFTRPAEPPPPMCA